MMKYKGLWEIAVLALLREAPMHPYQMQRLLRERRQDDLLVLKRGSLYNAIRRLAGAGLIEAVAKDRQGGRPERTTYRITAAGRDELARGLEERVRYPRREPSEFMAGLSFLIHLTPDEAVAGLGERVRRLGRECRELDARIGAARVRVGPIHVIESEYLLAMRRAELRWVNDLIRELRAGRLRWDFKSIVRGAAAARKAASSRKS